jgi:hypothetical protein
MKISYTGNSLLISSVAVVASIIAIAHGYLDDPRGKGLARYDFSTPGTAFFSTEEILHSDYFARLGLHHEAEGPAYAEFLKTLEVRKEVDDRGKKVLFISFLRKGVKKYETVTMEKNARSGRWVGGEHVGVTESNAVFSTLRARIGFGLGVDDRSELEKQQDRWRTRGEL